MPGTVKAAIYCRMSLAKMGDTTKVDDQERQCREVAGQRGWEVGRVYVDNSQSAWKRNRRRPGWEAMLSDIEAGDYGAIVSYWGDRLVRQPRDLEDLLDLRDVRHIRLASVMGEYDFDNKDHRMMMRWEVARACNESDTISMRKKNGLDRLRAQGITRPGGPGGRCFGFETDGIAHRPAETAAVRRAAAAILAGQSLSSVARQMAAEGITTTSGKPMHLNALRRILSYPRMAGLMPDGASLGAWEPVLERSEWEALQAVISLNHASPRAGKGALHLLSGIARCGVCQHVLWAGKNAAGPAYKCPDCGSVRRSMRMLDDYVGGAVCGRLNHPDRPAPKRPQRPDIAAEYAALTADRAELEAVIADHARGRLPALLARLDSLDRRLDELRALAGEDSRGVIVESRRDITWEKWQSLPLDVRRTLVSVLFTVEVLPASKRGPGFRPSDVRLTPL